MTKLSNKRLNHLHLDNTASRLNSLVDTFFKNDRSIGGAIRKSLVDGRRIIGRIRSSGRYDTSLALVRWVRVVLSRDERRERRGRGQQGQNGGKGSQLHVDCWMAESYVCLSE
jgi:hypothetical protein